MSEELRHLREEILILKESIVRLNEFRKIELKNRDAFVEENIELKQQNEKLRRALMRIADGVIETDS